MHLGLSGSSSGTPCDFGSGIGSFAGRSLLDNNLSGVGLSSYASGNGGGTLVT